MTKTKTFETTTACDFKGTVYLPMPFDPDTTWGEKPRHLVAGYVNEARFRGVIARFGNDSGISLGPWRRTLAIEAGTKVSVVLAAVLQKATEHFPSSTV